MKKFTIIDDEIYAVKNAGYTPDFENDTTHYDFPANYSERKQSREIDDFCDLDRACLCKDENGDLYAVQFELCTEKPQVWQKVRKA